MTTLRPERPADGPMSYEDTGQFAAVVQQLADPLNDPLPDRPPAVREEPAAAEPEEPPAPVPPRPPATRTPSPAPVTSPAPFVPAAPFAPPPPAAAPEVREAPAAPAAPPGMPFYATAATTDLPSAPSAASPWFRAPEADQAPPSPALAPPPLAPPAPPEPVRPEAFVRPEPVRPAAFVRPEAFVRSEPVAPAPEAFVPPEPVAPPTVPGPAPVPVPDEAFPEPVPEEPEPSFRAAAGDLAQTAQLPVIQLPPPQPEAAPNAAPDVAPENMDAGPPLSVDEPLLVSPPADGGRAARRKAARQGGGGHRARGRTSAAPATASPAEPAAPLSRVEARRAAKAAKDSPAVVISRIVGELFITTGVIMLLFVVYSLWWTNVRAHQQASSASHKLEQQWATGQDNPSPAAGTFDPGEGFAIMYIPKLDVKAPIAQGTDTEKVLNKGMIGHYDGALNTAMPWDKTGNFAVAAHRNTHGEPFRYINHLVPGDKVVVETSSTYYTYQITSSLASTPPSNVSVLQPVPVGSGFTAPGRYLTLTTCTPEFTSTNRLIVWGKLVTEQPRSKGQPAALTGG